MILKNGNVIHENTEVQIIMRPYPATKVIARLSEILKAFCFCCDSNTNIEAPKH